MPSLRTKFEAKLLRALMAVPPGVQRVLLRKPVVLDGQTLATETQMMLRLEELAREPKVEDLTVAQGRRALIRQAWMAGGRQPVGAIRELQVDGAAGWLPARLYLPSIRLGADPVPTVVYFHGGGWVYGDLESHDAALRHLAELSGVQVLAVDYRLAPESLFPAAVEDAVAAYRWVVANTAQINADPTRLAVGGDSAGGNLAALVALAAAREGLPLHFQLLIYPAVDFSTRTRSRELFGEGFFLSDKFMSQCEEWYLPEGHDRSDPLASPLLTADIPEGLAPAHVVTAGFDPLRDEGQAYAALLAEHGCSVDARCYSTMIHGFFNVVGAGREAPAYNREIATRLKRALG